MASSAITDKTFLLRILRGLALPIVLGTLLAAAGCNRDPIARAQKQFDSAQQLEKDGKTNEASLMYRRALQANPKLIDARMALAKLELAKGDFLATYKELAMVLKIDPNHLDARLMMAEFRFASKDFAGVEKEAQDLLAQHPQEPRAMLLLARSEVGLGDLSAAVSTVEETLRLQPTNSPALYLKAMILWSQGKKEESEKNMRAAVASEPAWMIPVGGLASMLVARKDVTGAEAVIRAAVEKNRTNPMPKYMLASFLTQQKRSSEAEEVYRQIKNFGERDTKCRTVLGEFYQATGKWDLAEKEYLQVVNAHADDLRARRLLAGIELDLGKQPQAEEQIQIILKDHAGDAETLMLRGILRVRQARLEEGVNDLQRAAQTARDSALSHFYLADAYLRQGKIANAKQELQTVKELQPGNLNAQLLLANLELTTGEANRALSTVDELIQKRPTVAQPYWVRSAALASSGDFVAAEKQLATLLDQFPQDTTRAITYRALARLKLGEKRYVDARKYSERALSLDPSSAEALFALGLSYIGMKQGDAGLAAVQARLKANSQWPAGYEVLGRLQTQLGRMGDAEVSLRKAIDLDSNLESAVLMLSNVYLLEKKSDESIKLVSELAQRQPNNVVPVLNLAQIYELRGDWKNAQINYEKAIKIRPDNAQAKNNLAYLYTEYGGNIDVALKMAEEARGSLPDDPRIADTLAWIYVKKHSYGNAIQLLKQSVDKMPKNPVYHYHLGSAYAGAGMNAEARQALQSALKLNPNFDKAQDARKLLNSLPE